MITEHTLRQLLSAHRTDSSSVRAKQLLFGRLQQAAQRELDLSGLEVIELEGADAEVAIAIYFDNSRSTLLRELPTFFTADLTAACDLPVFSAS